MLSKDLTKQLNKDEKKIAVESFYYYLFYYELRKKRFQGIIWSVSQMIKNGKVIINEAIRRINLSIKIKFRRG